MNKEKAKGGKAAVSSSSGERKGAGKFPVVGIGASAGGLRAFETFFRNLPAQPDMAFILVQHLDPDHESELAQLLQTHTKMPVGEARERMQVAANHVYVIPPGKSLSIENDVLHVAEPEQPRGQRALIDLFFRSLAAEQGANAVCVILSGTGSDGSLGLKDVKAAGGIVLVQDPERAEYEGMPRNAIATGVVDYVAPVAELARKLVEYRQSGDRIDFAGVATPLAEKDAHTLQRIFTQVRSHTGHDFSHYKRATILRRLQRRMQVNQLADLDSYLRFLRGNQEEIHALFADFLISVTNFFRDRDAFAALEQTVIPRLLEGKKRRDQIRIWVPGCATGEEAYSIAILLLEEATRREGAGEAVPAMRIFATDINEETLAFARRGLYPSAIAADLSAERLRRFFQPEGDRYRIEKRLQEMVLFAPHNLLKDAPFARLDLIACRNVLIYLEREMQQQIFRVFHYGLRPGGYLFLGSSEGADFTDRFEPVRKRQRIYRRRDMPAVLPDLPMRVQAAREESGERDGAGQAQKEPRLDVFHRDLMLQRYGPPSVLVNEDYEICYNFGDVGHYLRFSEGEPTLNILESVNPDLRVHLRTALFQVFRHYEAARPRFVRFEQDGREERVRLCVEPAPREETGEELALIIFEPAPLSERKAEPGAGRGNGPEQVIVEQLEEALKETRHRLQTTVEEYETSNEELKSSNEELQSMNEELRSTTEELETSREELRSTNEELSSVNEELKNKVALLDRANSDLENLIEATDIGILFVDRDLCLQRYTPEATELFNVLPVDVGRPFAQLSHRIDHGALPALAKEVLKTLETVEEEVRDRDGNWYLLHMRPYRTVEDRIDGVVITLVEITPQVEARQQEQLFAGQQRALAELGQYALRGAEVPALMEMALRLVTQTLSVPLAHIFGSGGSRLALAAAVGWEGASDETVSVPSGTGSQAGYTLDVGKPILVPDVRAEQRFETALPPQAGAVRSGMSVIIPGVETPSGVLEVYDRELRQFGQREVSFLETVAHVLGAAMERRQSREALRASQKRLVIAVEASGGGVYEHSVPPDGSLYYSSRWVAILGYQLEELPPPAERVSWVVEQIHPDELPDLERAYADFVEGRTPTYEVEVRMCHKQGHWVWVRAFAHAMERDEAGRVLRIAGLLFDIDERKRTEEGLRERERILEAVLEQMPSGLSLAEAPSGKLIRHNEEAVRLLRHPLLSTKSYADYSRYGALHDIDEPFAPVEYPIARALDGEVVHQEEMLYRRGDGTLTTFSVNAAPIRDEKGEIVMAVSTFHDISPIKRLQEELEAWNELLEQRVEARTQELVEARDRFHALFHATPVPTMLSQVADGTIMDVNDAYLRFFGHEREGVLGRTTTELNVYADPLDRAALRQAVTAEGYIYDREVRLLGPGGEVRLASASSALVPLEGQTVAISTFVDLTERIRQEERIRALASALTVAEQRERERIAQVLHDDLQQLLYAVQTQLLLLSTTAAIEESEELHAYARSLQQLSDEALAVTRTLTVELSPPVLEGEGMDEAFQWLAGHMGEVYGLEVELTVEGEPALTNSDMEELAFQIVRELLFNVVKHAGVLQARLSVQHREDGVCVIEVADTGKGFDVGAIEAQQGAGFGLRTIRERVMLFKGDLSIVSAPGTGTSVTLSFPCAGGEGRPTQLDEEE